MAISTEPQATEPHHDAIGVEAVVSAAAAVVSDYTALLYYTQTDSLRWNGLTDVGTQVIVTYSFDETDELADVATDPYGAASYWSYSTEQRDLFRDVLDQFETVSGVIFVEVEGTAMINIFGATGGSAGGWANVAQSNLGYTSTGTFVNAYTSMNPGNYGYQINLHELGHAMGLQHPQEGSIVLDGASDTQANTVMTYNIGSPFVTDLGVFDVQALQEIYGTPDSMAGWTVTVGIDDVVQITATNTSEVILAVAGDSIILAGAGSDEVFGREGNDELRAQGGADQVIGGLGSDLIYGNSGNDYLIGDLDENVYSGGIDDNDRVYGGPGNDSIFGGNGEDTLSGERGSDVIYGGQGDDLVNGGDGHDVLSGDNGNDVILGGRAFDTVYGGSGDDTLYGNSGYDELYGGAGEDVLIGGTGSDTLSGGDGADQMRGGQGSDVFLFLSEDAFETNTILDFGSGLDIIDISDLGFSSLGQLTVAVANGNTTLSYSNWFNLELSNFVGPLVETDFVLA